MCEAATMGVSMCEAATMRVRGMCEAATMGARHVQGSYKGCEACARQLQWV